MDWRPFAAALLWCGGCDAQLPEVVLNDGGLPGRGRDARTAAVDDAALTVAVEPRYDGVLAIEPSAGWTSPPPCPGHYDDAFCSVCYDWPSGPASLDRNEDGDRFGASMAIADFNGDGYPDLAVGAPGEDVGSNADAGAVYVYLGTVRGFEPWKVLHYEPWYGSAPAGMGFGTALAAGDIDEDGYADLLVALGPNETDQWVTKFRGGSFGMSPWGPDVRLFDIDPDTWSADYSEFGAALELADVDQDGHLDLVVGAPAQYVYADSETTGAVYVVPGDGTDLDQGSATRLVPSSLSMISSGMRFGETVAVAQLVGSSALDVAVGVPSEEGVYVYESGSTALVVLEYSGRTGLGASLAAGDMGTSATAKLFVGGAVTTYLSGFLNLDSMGGYDTWDLDDALVGAAVGLADLEVSGTDQLVVQLADSGFVTSPVLGVANLGSMVEWSFFVGESVPREDDDDFGHRVIVADVDGDGRRDLVVAAPSGPGDGGGRVYVFGVEDADHWVDWERWEGVWGDAGYEYLDPGDPPYTDPMPVQVVTQETTPGDCDLCQVFELPEGESCGETSAEICVEGACFTRTGCGDGYREPAPGSTEWPREGCDDGNEEDGDACSSTCEPTRLVVSSQPFEEASPGGPAPALAEDGAGELLFVYTADAGESRELRARRFSSAGVAREEDTAPIVIATGLTVGWNVQPTVAGLSSGGWMVAWADPAIDGDASGIAVRNVSSEGVPGTARAVNVERRGVQHEPRAFSFDGGYGVAWVDEGGFDGPLGGSIVKARAFADSGTVFLDEFAVSATDAVASEPAVVVGEGALFVWTEAALDWGEPSYVMGRAMGESLGDPFVISSAGGGEPAVIGVPGEPMYVVAWVRRDPAYDYLGDLLLRIVDLSEDPPWLSDIIPLVERDPEDPPHAELAPALALIGEGAVFAYESGGRRRGAEVGSLFTSPPGEATALADYLQDGMQGDMTLLRTSRGVWFAWSDASGFGAEDAYRSFLAFLLPHD